MLARIQRSEDGWVFSPTDFIDLGRRYAVDKALSRMAAAGSIRRVARGLYDVPKQHPIVGTTTPHIDEVAKAVAGKGSLRVVPPEHRLKALREDYAKIQQMFFGQPLTFDDILAVLHQWETDFNHQ
jgi:hypothetical protein